MHQAQWSPERPLPPPVSLASPSHHEKPPEVTCTSRGNPGFPASTRESPRETSFNTSRGQIPLPWLGSNDALPLATRTETRLPWRPTRGSLTSPSYLVRNRTLGPPLENNLDIPPSSRDEGLRLLHRSEEHTSESSHHSISYAVFCLKKKKNDGGKPGKEKVRKIRRQSKSNSE